MAISIGTLTLELEALTLSFEKDMAGVTRSLDMAARAVGRVGDAAGAGAAALVSMGGDAVEVAGDFEAAMTKAAIVTDNLGAAGEENFGRLEDAALSAASVTEFTATESARAIELMGQAGFETAEILEGLPKVLQLASAASVTVAKATDTAANTISAFGLSVEDDLSRVNDVFVTTANSANTNFLLLSSAMKQVAPIARSINLEIEDTAALLGKLADNGIKGAKAGTALSGIFASMLNPSRAVRETIDDLGLSFTDEEGNLKSFSQIMEEMGPIANDTGALFKIFGRRGGPAMAALLNEGVESIDTLADKLRNSAGAAALAAEANMATFQGRMAQLNSKIEGAQIIIGDLVKDALLPLVAVLDDVVQAFIELPDWVQTSMVAIAAAAAAVLTLVAAFAGLVATIASVAAAVAALTAVKVTLGAIGAIVATVATVVLAIGAGILGAVSIVNQLHNIWLFFERDITRGIDSIGSGLVEMGGLFLEGFVVVLEEISGLFMETFGDSIAAVIAIANDAWDATSAFFREVYGQAFDWLEATFGESVRSLSELFDDFVDGTADLIMGVIPDAWQSAFHDARVAFPDFLTELEILGKNIVKVIGAAFESVFDSVKAAFKTIFDVLAAAAGFGLEVTGVQEGGDEQQTGGFFGNIGRDLVESLGFDSLAQAGDRLSQAFAEARSAIEKSTDVARPRRRTAASLAAAREATKEAEKAVKAATKENEKEAKAKAKLAKAKEKTIDDELKASRKALADGIARDEKRTEDAKKQAAAAASAQKKIFDSWTEALQSSLIGSLGDMGEVINSALQALSAGGGVWGAVIAVLLDLLKRTDGFNDIVSELDEVFGALVDAIGPLTQSLVPLVAFISDNLVAVFDALGVAFRFVGVVLSGIVIFVLSIFKALADAWNGMISAIERLVNKLVPLIEIDLSRLKIQTGGLEDALASAKSNIEEFALGTKAVTQEQEEETQQLRELNEQLTNAPEGFKVSLARFNATIREGASGGGGGGPFASELVSGPAGGSLTIEQITVFADDPEEMLEKIEEQAQWGRFRKQGTSRKIAGQFSSAQQRNFGSA